MQNIGINKLLKPELLSHDVLVEILMSRCINVLQVKSASKTDLLNMFKKLALPLPQRHYNEAKVLGKKLTELRNKRNIKVAVSEDENLFKCMHGSVPTKYDSGCISSQNTTSKSFDDSNMRRASAASFFETPTANNKNTTFENGLKRINNEQIPVQVVKKKYQKITWP